MPKHYYAPAGARRYERNNGCHNCLFCSAAYAQQDKPVLVCTLKGALPKFPGCSHQSCLEPEKYDELRASYYQDLNKKATVPWAWCVHWYPDGKPRQDRVAEAYGREA